MQKKYGWGWSQNYMLTGLKEIHPMYGQSLQMTTLQTSEIQEKLLSIKSKESFDKKEIEGVGDQSVGVVIPARYKSSRFPGKPLAEINGKPMIIRVADICAEAVGTENVFVATENQRIMDVVRANGYNVIMTSNDCLTGTDRVAEAAYEIDRDIIVNVQGDEPLLDSNDILRVIAEKIKYPKAVINCMSSLESNEDPADTKIPKVVTDNAKYLMYMSRSAIPGSKYGLGEHISKQVCIYAFNKKELHMFLERSNQGKTPLEWVEDIEILRFLEMGLKVKMVEIHSQTHAVDFPEDIEIVERLLNENR
jgi:3-deoxy-manno-octulosonate cytidylyltransferase (CMP-KDO synthetase)